MLPQAAGSNVVVEGGVGLSVVDVLGAARWKLWPAVMDVNSAHFVLETPTPQPTTLVSNALALIRWGLPL